ncbi:MAG: hypothetical protein ACLTYW_07515 [Collinsella sp.]
MPQVRRGVCRPLDRRFHAQPDACFDCGPHITWREAGNGVREFVRDTSRRHHARGSDAIIEPLR